METHSTRSHRRDLLVSDQPWEIEFIHRHFPKHTHDEVVEALEDCRRELAGSEDRQKILNCLESRLAPITGDGVD